jgi:hypothetical protein
MKTNIPDLMDKDSRKRFGLSQREETVPDGAGSLKSQINGQLKERMGKTIVCVPRPYPPPTAYSLMPQPKCGSVQCWL